MVFITWSMLSRAGVTGNRKLILVLIQERTLLLVSGRIESSAFSLLQPSRGLAFSSTSDSMVCVLGFAYSLYPPGQFVVLRQSAH